MTDSEIAPEASAAAEWWTEQLRGEVEMDNGDMLQSAMGSVVSNKNRPYDDEDLDQFEQVLARLIDESDFRERTKYIAVDYQPDSILAEAGTQAGFEHVGMTTFPWKTNMWIQEGEVQVSSGYGAESVTVYDADSA